MPEEAIGDSKGTLLDMRRRRDESPERAMRVLDIDQLDESCFEYDELDEVPGVRRILSAVKEKGDEALRAFTLELDGVRLKSFKVEREEIKSAYSMVDEELVSSIRTCADRLRRFSGRQMEQCRGFEIEIEPGVRAGQVVVPIERVGVYVPGGRFPLVSSLLMGAVPSKVAGVNEVVACSPPGYRGSVHPATLVAADISGVDEVYKVGGAQAVAAMAYGTASIERVNKIVGPGNNYVNAAKKLLFGRVGIDFTAGPTEILIIADQQSDPALIAADLIAQAEHDLDSKLILATDSRQLAKEVQEELESQLTGLKTVAIARKSLKRNGMAVIVKSIAEALDFANKKAPEHLGLDVQDAEACIPKLRNYGALFVGSLAATVLGDYSSGLSHVLPTHYASRYTGGLSVRDFLKIQSILRVSGRGLSQIGSEALTLAEAEGLHGHANAVRARMRSRGGA